MDQKRVTEILQSILAHQNAVKYRDIQTDTEISTRILRPNYLEPLKAKHFITEDAKGWKKGKSKRFSVAVNGRIYLIKQSLSDVINALNLIETTVNTIISEAKTPEMRVAFKKLEAALNFCQSPSIIQQYYIESAKKGDLQGNPLNEVSLDEIKDLDILKLEKQFNPSSSDGPIMSTLSRPLYEAVKKSFELQLYFNFQDPDPESLVDNLWAIFSPKMRLFCMYKQGTKAILDEALYQIEKEAISRIYQEELERKFLEPKK